MGFQHNVPLLLVTMTLIVVGGIGFLTLEELVLWNRAGSTEATPRNDERRRRADRQDANRQDANRQDANQPNANRPNTRRGDRDDAGRPLTGRSSPGGERRFRLSVHSQIVLATTALLIVVGWVLFTVFEWGNTLSGMPAWARVTNGLFASVTTRTAGFNTIDYASAYADTNFLTILFMSIGGSPGSTAGGLKTTTFALLGLVAWARLRGHATVSISGRSIPEETIQKAIGLFVVGFGIVTAAIYGFSIVELKGLVVDASHGSFLAMMFEAVSAFNTVGLSMGVTGELTVPGRWMTVVLMFIGRVGPLTVAAAMSRRKKKLVGGFRYAYEDVAVG
jgi:trk system potassium uptake protein TrkH